MNAPSKIAYALLTALSLCTVDASAKQWCCRPCEPDPADWEGFYLSGQLGMGRNSEDEKFANDNYFNTIGATLLGNHFNHTSEGVLGGGSLGYNIQFGAYVFGIEGGAVSTNFQKTFKSPFFPDSDVYKTHLQCIANGKARLGYCYDTFLAFVTGGWAGGHYSLKLDDTGGDVVAKSKTWANGWTVGVGFDCKFYECWSMGLEYDYVQLHFHDKHASCPSCGSGVGLGSPLIDDRMNIQTLTLRLNYYFNL